MEGKVDNLNTNYSKMEGKINGISVNNAKMEGTINGMSVSNAKMEGKINSISDSIIRKSWFEKIKHINKIIFFREFVVVELNSSISGQFRKYRFHRLKYT
jgi:hypothetical protein